MSYLIDTNVLLRHIEPKHPMYPAAVNAITSLLASGERLCVVPQNIAEFWNVCTRPLDQNGLGLTPKQADSEVTRIEVLLTVLPDIPSIYPEWRRIVRAHAVSGSPVHDARIVAAMLAHGIAHLVTFNRRDFVRYSGITVLTPAEVIQAHSLR